MSSTTRCPHCGAPARTGDARCSYCHAPISVAVPPDVLAAAVHQALRKDSDGDGVPDILERPEPPRVAPAPPAAPVATAIWIGAGATIAMALAGMVAALSISPSPRREPARPQPKLLAPTATETSRPVAPAPPASTTSVASAEPPTPVKPTVKMTSEQFGKSRVAAAAPKLRFCVEQDLVRNASVPTAYSVTVHVEADGLPLNSATTFSPAPTEGLRRCAGTAIFYAFNTNITPPKLEAYTFTTSFSFPDAKPAKKAESGRGWD